MKGLLIVAHGSRRENSNQEVRELTAKVADRSSDKFDLIDCAFLELAEPSIPQGITDLINKGSTSVTVVPYFLAKGTHVADDIPEEVAKAQKQHSSVPITVSNYLGASETMVDVLVNIADESMHGT